MDIDRLPIAAEDDTRIPNHDPWRHVAVDVGITIGEGPALEVDTDDVVGRQFITIRFTQDAYIRFEGYGPEQLPGIDRVGDAIQRARKLAEGPAE